MAEKEITIQRYLSKPLLIDGLKFDLRVYVVVVGIDPIEAFVADEGLARFCTVKYKKPIRSNFSKKFMHLTNYAVNKNSDNYVRIKSAKRKKLKSSKSCMNVEMVKLQQNADSSEESKKELSTIETETTETTENTLPTEPDEDEILSDNKGTKRTLTSLFHTLE
jgi:tubulin polyglutamylase TTLL6/13